MLVKIKGWDVEIDDNIADIIVMLNQKGYGTKFCCEGHDEKNILHVYVCFDKVYDFKNSPKGMKSKIFQNQTLIEFLSVAKNLELRKLRKLDRVAQLRKWAKELPNNPDIENNR
jgi:hypothetical protein